MSVRSKIAGAAGVAEGLSSVRDIVMPAPKEA